MTRLPGSRANGWWSQLRERGVLRVAASYAVIAWLLLQIADVTFEPLGLPGWAMPALIVTAVIGLPIAVLLATVAVLLVRQSDIGRPPLPEKPSLAVLPFENLSGDPEQEYFSDGLAEEVLDRLARVPGSLSWRAPRRSASRATSTANSATSSPWRPNSRRR